MGEELFFGKHQIELIDEHFAVNPPRVGEYINFEFITEWDNVREQYDFGPAGIQVDEVIHVKYFMMINRGGLH